MLNEIFDKPLIELPVSGIYAIINKQQKRLYVGSSINVLKRTRDHINHLKRNKHHCKHLQNAWNKYGESEFSCVLLEKVDVDFLPQELRPIKLFSFEQRYLDELFPMKVLYNSAKVAGVHKKFGLDIDKQVREILYTAHMKGAKIFIDNMFSKDSYETFSKEFNGIFSEAFDAAGQLLSKKELITQKNIPIIKQPDTQTRSILTPILVRVLSIGSVGITLIITTVTLLFHFGFCCK